MFCWKNSNLYNPTSFSAMMEFSSPVMTGCLPSPRSWHASAVLPKQRIFIHGGYDGNQILTDSFIFDLSEFGIVYIRMLDFIKCVDDCY